MKIVFLDAISMGDVSLEEIASLGDFTSYPSSTAQQARERVKDADVVLLNKVVVDQTFLDAAPRLKLVCEAGTGINNIDVELCKKRGVVVRNVAGYSTDSVAQTAWMHILNLAGHAFHYQEFVGSGQYSKNPVHVDYRHPFVELAGKTLGIVGMGAIGQKVAAIARAFGMEVIYFSTSGTGHCKDYPCVSLDELLERSDVISIHAPYNERTAGLMGYEQLRKMKPTEEIDESIPADTTVDASLLKKETLSDLAKALKTLPQEQQDIVVLLYYDRIPMTEIAQMMHLSYGMVKLRHQNALIMLKKMMGE